MELSLFLSCFSCGSSVQNWSLSDDPASAEWHYDTCELVLGKDKRNKPILPRPLRFVGKSEISSASSYDESNGEASTSSVSFSNPSLLKVS